MTFQNQEKSTVPHVTFAVQNNGQWQKLTSKDIFSGKKVIVFALPGAYTPTCSSSHLPRYNELAHTFKANGIDAIYCLSVNDSFVMNAWAKDQRLNNVQMLPDGNGEFSEKMGFLVDKSGVGFGKRSWRYSMYVEDGVIQKMFIEPEKPGDPFEVSDADTMLKFLFPNVKAPARVSMISKKGCVHCQRAKDLLASRGMPYEEIELGNSLSNSTLFAISGRTTTPQIFIDGKHIGGADDLQTYLA